MKIFSFFWFFLTAFYEPTDMRKAHKPFSLPLDLVRQIKFISPNVCELDAIAKDCHAPRLLDSTAVNIDHLFRDNQDFLGQINAAAVAVTDLVDCVLVTLGANGVLVVRKDTGQSRFFDDAGSYVEPSSAASGVQSKFYTVEPVSNVVNVSGAGDSFTTGFLAAMIRAKSEETCVAVGRECAKAALRSHSAVPANYFASNHHCWNEQAEFISVPTSTLIE